jgi:peptidoglycan/xylan/chitin deacetylase (PgdA/CDA1 family)
LDKWGNYEVRIHNSMDKIFQILSDNDVKATFFVVGYIARKHPEIIKRIHELGYELGAHSDMHKVAYRQSRGEFKQDLLKCVNSIQDITGEKVITYRAPGFSINKYNVWAFEVLKELGIECRNGVFGANMQIGLVNDGPVSFIFES